MARTPAAPPHRAGAPTESASLQPLSRALQGAFAVDAVVWLLDLLAHQRRLAVIDSIPAGRLAAVQAGVVRTAADQAAYDRLTNAALWPAITLAAGAVLGLVTAGLFIAWLYRARSNADGYGGPARRLTPYWAVGGWFVPLANLVLPVLVVLGVWRDSAVTPKNRVAPLTWWCALLLGVAAEVGAAVDLASGRADVLASAEIFRTIAAALLIVAAAFGALTVWYVTGWQNHRAAERATRKPPGRSARRRTAAAH